MLADPLRVDVGRALLAAQLHDGARRATMLALIVASPGLVPCLGRVSSRPAFLHAASGRGRPRMLLDLAVAAELPSLLLAASSVLPYADRYVPGPPACRTYWRHRAAWPEAPRTARTPYASQPRACRGTTGAAWRDTAHCGAGVRRPGGQRCGTTLRDPPPFEPRWDPPVCRSPV